MRRKYPQNWEFVILIGLFLANGNGAVSLVPRSAHAAAKKPVAVTVASVMASARIFEEQGQTERAIQLYRRILAEHPDFRPAREKLDALTREDESEALAADETPESRQLARPVSRAEAIPIDPTLPVARQPVIFSTATRSPAAVRSNNPDASAESARPHSVNIWIKTLDPFPVEPMEPVAQAAPSRKSDSPWTTADSPPLNDVRESRFSVNVTQRETSRRAQRSGQSGGVSAKQVSLSRSSESATDVLAWIEKLRDPDPMVRVGAVYRLGTMGPQARGAISSLEDMLFDESDVIRIHAILALWKIDKRVPSVIDYYAEIFKGDDKELKGLAKHVLREIGNGIPFGAAVIPMSDDTNAADQIAAAKTLCKVQKHNALSRLIFIHSLTKGDRNSRLSAAYAFATLAPRDDASIQSLIQALDDQDAAVRVAATYALGCIGRPAERAAPLIMKFVVSNEYDSDLRDSAFHAIHAIDPDLAKTIDLGGSEEAEPAE